MLFGGTPKAQAEAPHRIGVLAPLTGDVAPWGQDTERALRLANELLGEGKFRLIFEDDQCLGREAARGAQKLLSVDKIDYGMIVCTEPTLTAAPIFERAKVLVVAPGATGAAVTDAGDYIFRTWPSDREMVRTVIDYVAKHYHHPELLTELRGFPQEFSRVFLEFAKSKNLPVVSEEFLSEERDFKALIARARSHSPDALILSTDSHRTLLSLVDQIAQYKWDIPLIGNYIAGTPVFYNQAGSRAEGFVFGDAPAVDCEKQLPGCEVYREFVKRYGEAQSSPFMVASAVAAFMVIREAAKSDEDGRNFLYHHTFDTLLGPIGFDENGDVTGLHHTLKRIHNSMPMLLE